MRSLCILCIPNSVNRADLSKRVPGCRGAEKVDTLSENMLDFCDSLKRWGSNVHNNLRSYLNNVLKHLNEQEYCRTWKDRCLQFWVTGSITRAQPFSLVLSMLLRDSGVQCAMHHRHLLVQGFQVKQTITNLIKYLTSESGRYSN